MKRVFLAALAGWGIAACGVAADSGPAGEFTATARVETPAGTRSMGLSIFVLRPMTVDEAQPLKKVLEDGGQQALLNAIRGGNRGHFRLGAIDYPIDLAIAEPDRDGFKYILVTARALKYEEVQEGSASLEHPFTIAVFQVPGFGSGEGTLYTKAAVSVEADGHIRVDQYDNRGGTLRDVKRR